MSTSRWRLQDAVEMIQNYCAIDSHLREKIEGKKQKEDTKNLENLQFMRNMALLNRRKLMKKVLEQLPEDEDHMRCIIKHAISIYGLGGELENADPIFGENALDASETLNVCLSILTGQPLTFCGRCLWDQLNSDNELTNLSSTNHTEWVVNDVEETTMQGIKLSDDK